MAKHYDKQFKLDAIKYRQTHPELSVAAVCRNLNISEATYYKWSAEYKNDGDINHRGSGNFSMSVRFKRTNSDYFLIKYVFFISFLLRV